MKIFYILLFVMFTLYACSKSDHWIYGNWEINPELTFKQAGPDSEKSFVGLSVAIMEGFKIDVREKEIIVSHKDKTKNMKYNLVEKNDGTILVDTNETDYHFGKDSAGIYLIGQEDIRVKGKTEKGQVVKIYLTPSA